jgi:hypothetical protein
MLDKVHYFKDDWYSISEEEYKLAADFAKKRAEQDGDYMVDNRDVTSDKFYKDTLRGAFAEIVAVKVLPKEFGLDPSVKPDFKIYSKTEKAKKTSKDLTYGKYNIHVIHCPIETVDKYGESYARNNSDKLFNKKNLKSPYNLLMLMLVDEDKRKVQPRALVSWKYIIDNDMMGEPALKRKYGGKKKFLYYSSLESINATM